MGILGMFLGRTTVLDYEILFDDKDLVSVKINPQVTPIKLEYCKLCFLYLTKIIYNFGGKSATSSVVALDAMNKIGKKGIGPNTDCFKLANFDDVIKYSNKVENVVTRFTGTFYSWNNGSRTIDTKFPLNGTEQQTVFGFLALLQYAINENKDDHSKLKFIEASILGISSMYTKFDGSNISDIAGIPTAIFMQLEG